MARQALQAEINAFVKGLITEASPLTFPENASLDEQNMILNRDGSRRRRYGMDLEEGYSSIDSGQTSAGNIAFKTFDWKNPGGHADKEFAVVQSGVRISIFDVTSRPVSGNLLGTFDIIDSASTYASIATVDRLLIIASGTGNVYVFDYDGSLSYTTNRLKIRDLFGVEDKYNGTDLREGSGLLIRPASLSDGHLYNLRNQTYATPRKTSGSTGSIKDCLDDFYSRYSVFQSNSDSAIPYLYAQTNESTDRETIRYFSRDNYTNPMGSYLAPIGYFIIDAMNRGDSRLEQERVLRNTYSELKYSVGTLPADRTPGGASVVSGYAGRMFFSGFSSQITDGDGLSPRMSSYILFSRLVQNPSDIFKCYQDGDPTSKDAPDLVDTDGGFLRIEGMSDVKGMYDLGEVLMVVAGNGVWYIEGGSGYGFKATDYKVTKITGHGCVSAGSIVVVDNALMYWGQDGIYSVSQNQYGDWDATNITTNTIQSYVDDIDYIAKVRCQGIFDSYTRRAKWLLYNYLDASSDAIELTFDVALGAFYPSKFPQISGGYPFPIGYITVPPYSLESSESDVVTNDGTYIVDSNSNNIATDVVEMTSEVSEVFYLSAIGTQDGTLRYSFSYFKDSDFLDWKSVDGTGVDAAAYLLTGWTGAGDYQRKKALTYMTIYSLKTETGFDSDCQPVGQSSVLVQSQWNWTNLESSNKWGQFFQAYRHRRAWMPTDSSSGFDDGDSVVVTRNKIRGNGRVISFLFKSEAGKDMRLLGWSLVMSVGGNV